MMAGLPPFYASTRDEIFKKILTEGPSLPDGISREGADLIQRLLTKNPDLRIGSSRGACKDIKEHPWFSGVDWAAYLRKDTEPPFVPILSSDLDLSNFSPEFTNLPLETTTTRGIFDDFDYYPDFEGKVPCSCH